MKTLREAAEDYINLRRALGFKFTKAEPLLKDYASFMERENASYITSPMALAWAKEPQNVLQSYRGSRLTVVRGFAQYLSSIDSQSEVPPYGLLPYKYH